MMLLYIISQAHGAWASWSEGTSCSASCHGGLKRMDRTCTNPSPANGGYDCDGDGTTMVACNDIECECR